MGTPIFVLDQQGQPLMPSRRHNKVWYWLRKGLARLVRRDPFTIQLRFETAHYTQDVTVGVDTGSQTVGIAAITNAEVVVQAEVHLRTDIKGKLDQRRQYRRNRRSRKTRYRVARFANRGKLEGQLPPSLSSKAQTTIKAVRWVATLLPVHQVKVEVGSFDTQKMQNPEITGVSYQQGELYGYLVREYVLSKWKRECSYCHIRGIPLQLEHIVPKARGGSDRVSNLCLACETCNLAKGTQTAAEFGYPQVQAQAKLPLKDAAHVCSIKTRVLQDLQATFGESQVQITYGYQTKYQRMQVLDLPKSHINDAVAIACEIGEEVTPLEVVHHLRALSRGQYQRFNGFHSEHKCWAPRKVRGFKLYEQVQARGKIGYIGGRREKGAFVLRDRATGKPLLEVAPSRMTRISRPHAGWLIFSETGTGKEEEAPPSC
ncbi:MAG TPA: RNA-guided endonuclease IscB [Ktedonosporobacter sp.]|jgi:5-methylcytosine-specific restriction endonuclease McrA|nr:RNA-guided endonuclease IscB [Ktedonosporobacter sp.]